MECLSWTSRLKRGAGRRPSLPHETHAPFLPPCEGCFPVNKGHRVLEPCAFIIHVNNSLPGVVTVVPSTETCAATQHAAARGTQARQKTSTIDLRASGRWTVAPAAGKPYAHAKAGERSVVHTPGNAQRLPLQTDQQPDHDCQFQSFHRSICRLATLPGSTGLRAAVFSSAPRCAVAKGTPAPSALMRD